MKTIDLKRRNIYNKTKCNIIINYQLLNIPASYVIKPQEGAWPPACLDWRGRGKMVFVWPLTPITTVIGHFAIISTNPKIFSWWNWIWKLHIVCMQLMGKRHMLWVSSHMICFYKDIIWDMWKHICFHIMPKKDSVYQSPLQQAKKMFIGALSNEVQLQMFC